MFCLVCLPEKEETSRSPGAMLSAMMAAMRVIDLSTFAFT
jgi:hypothetical protein